MLEIHDLWILLCALMVLEMQAGFLCLEAGLVRSKNALNVALKNITDLGVVCLIFWAVGFGMMFGPTFNGWIGFDGFLFDGTFSLTGDSPGYGIFFFQLAFAGTAATIVSGAVSERAHFKGYLIMAVVIAALIYPVYGHWAWGSAFVEGQGTWLSDLGFIDFAGSTVVHGIGGWIALTYVVALGPRIGRFGRYRRSFEPSNLVIAALGTLFLWIGWFGFNAGSTLVFSGEVPEIMVNTALAAAASSVSVLLFDVMRNETPKITRQLNGILAGLVAITASCHIVDQGAAVLIGCIGGMVMIVSSWALERAKIDDAVDAAPVHLFAGIWGTLAVALFGDASAFASGDRWTQLGVQTVGVVTAGVWAVAIAGSALWLINLISPLRVSFRAEREGLNVSEHGQANALYKLTKEMQRHRADGRFKQRARVEPATEAGFVAKHYNMVLQKAETELHAREEANTRESRARALAEQTQDALQLAKKKSEFDARHDPLTGLANRRYLDEAFERIEAAYEAGELRDRIAVICVDLDRFKAVNDTYGHAAGDAVLKSVANTLRDVSQKAGFIARIGGDEFVLLLRASFNAQVEDVSRRILLKLREPIAFEGNNLLIGGSIGYSISEDGGMSPREVLKQADLALYEAKNSGRMRVEPFSERLAAAAEIRQELSEDIAVAIREGQFEPFFQPQFDARTERLSGVEALARWRHPTKGVLTPIHFLDIAEELGETPAIDDIVLAKSIQALREWDMAGFDVPRLSVNVSAQRLRTPNLVEDLVERHDIPKGRLSFEILETVFVDAKDEVLNASIAALKSLGIHIEIDDFGTGHASVASILALQPDKLKLDRLFVQGIESNDQRRRLLRSMIGIADSMGLSMVAEGVENREQASVLRAEGCDHLQGFAFAPPMERGNFDLWLKDGSIPLLSQQRTQGRAALAG